MATVSVLFFSTGLYAQTDTTSIYDLHFSELARIKITSASKVSQSISEVPATVIAQTAYADDKKRPGNMAVWRLSPGH